MEKINVQILFTAEEYAKLKAEADKLGLTVSLYIRGEMLREDGFTEAYQKLIKKVEALPTGTRFNIRSLFGVEWTMSRGVKLNLGKTYYSRVRDGVFSNVRIQGKDSSNVMWYEKL
ncbi:MAG: single-stranded DNA-binding protein [Oscillospiraceae bacterium]